MIIREILTDINAIQEKMIVFERKYGLHSDAFYTAYTNGEAPEDDNRKVDFGEWATLYQNWLARKADYINEIKRIQRNEST